MFALPPPLPARDHVLASAVRRGISKAQIARCSGLSSQRIDQIIQRFEISHGAIIRRAKRPRKLAANEPVRCKTCGMLEWKSESRKKSRIGYCSRYCGGVSRRILSHETIIQCIDGRYSGQTWTGLGLLHKETVQLIQYSIWIFLFETRDLTIERVERIWRPVSESRHNVAKWNWLVNITGKEPRRNEGERMARNKNASTKLKPPAPPIPKCLLCGEPAIFETEQPGMPFGCAACGAWGTAEDKVDNPPDEIRESGQVSRKRPSE